VVKNPIDFSDTPYIELSLTLPNLLRVRDDAGDDVGIIDDEKVKAPVPVHARLPQVT
jgi:hypothetical protein